MIPVAGYCRVSTDKDDQANSFAAQQRYFREYIAGHPQWQLYEIYADEGISGTSTRKRTEFNRMIRDAHAGKFRLIITKEISRFSRNILDTISYTRQLKSIGVGVLFMTENINTLNPESEMLLSFMGTIAQEESRRTSVRVKWGQTRQMERGVVFGRSLLGYTVRGGAIAINEAEAEIVRLIFHLYGIEQKSASYIARELQTRGYRTPSGNTEWSRGYVIKILNNEKYVGDLIQKKTITPDYLTHRKRTNRGEEALVIIENHHSPIIDRDLWNTVQQQLRARSKQRKNPQSVQYPFSGKIKCGECGGNFVSRYRYCSDGTKHRRWGCGTAVRQGKMGCEVGKLLRDEDAWCMVKTAFKQLQVDRETVLAELASLVCSLEESQHDLSSVDAQIERLSRKKSAALDAYFSGDISRQEMIAAKQAYDAELQRLEDRRNMILQRDKTGERYGAIERELSVIINGDTDDEALIRMLVESITVHKDRHVELRLKGLPLVFIFSE